MTRLIYSKRLKHLIQQDYEINKLEYEISQKCITLYETIQSFKTIISKHYQELLLNKKELRKLRYTNGKLSNFLKKQIDDNLEIRKRVNELQIQYNDKHEKLVRNRQEKLFYMCSLRILKEITNIYTNKAALNSIKFAITYQGERHTKWVLLHGSLNRYALWEIIDILWIYIEKNLAKTISGENKNHINSREFILR